MVELIALNLGLTLVGILGTMAGLVTMSIVLGRQLRELEATTALVSVTTERVATLEGR